jgi:hypothetical protein
MTMLRHLVLGLAAATFVATTLIPAAALAHHRGHAHRYARHVHYIVSDPRAARAGYSGPHYGRDCYRAGNGRVICPVLFREL